MSHLLIVADDPLVGAGLATLLRTESDHAVIGQVSSQEVLADLELYQPDLIIWDLGWEPHLTPDLAEVAARLPVIVLLADKNYTAEIWSAGVQGLLPRQVKTAHLLAACLAIHSGLTVIDPTLRNIIAPPSSEAPLLEPLTPRELEVLQLLAEGLPNKLIATRLAISDHTVKFHVNAIFSKLQAQSRTEAVVKATRLGLVLL